MNKIDYGLPFSGGGGGEYRYQITGLEISIDNNNFITVLSFQ